MAKIDFELTQSEAAGYARALWVSWFELAGSVTYFISYKAKTLTPPQEGFNGNLKQTFQP